MMSESFLTLPLAPLLIRADANPQMGIGHVMRCLALAQVWRRRGGRVVFAAADSLPPALDDRLVREGMTVHTISAAVGSLEDATEVLTLSVTLGARAVILDGYAFGEAYQAALTHGLKEAGGRVLVLDDYGQAAHYTAQIVLNQNVYADARAYPHHDPDTRFLLGTPFALVRGEFQAWTNYGRETSAQARKLLVTLGGSDPANLTGMVLRALALLPPTIQFEVVVVIGGGHPSRPDLEAAVRHSRHSIRLEVNSRHMPEHMAWAEVAISASGSTVWELAFMGVPSILIAVAENQHPIARTMAALGAAIGFETPPAEGDLAAALAALSEDGEQLRAFAQGSATLVDGLGAERVIRALTQTPPLLTVRPVDEGDRRLLWRWANDPTVRANSFNPAPISWEAHCAWFARQMGAADVRFWLLAADGVPVGHIRYDREGDSAILSYTVAPGERGQGFGTELLRRTAARACRELGVRRVSGVTFTANHASIRAFQKAGFQQAQPRVREDRPSLEFVWDYIEESGQ